MTMLNTPMFFAAVPRTLLDWFIALKPDPATGKPDPEKVKAFAATHPDNTAQARFLEDHNPPAANDPILLFRSPSYGVSSSKRLQGL